MATGFKISGVDVYDMKTVSGVEVISDWEVVKEFDFTQASGSAFVDGTSQSFGGVDWTATNITSFAGTGGYIQFIEGTGLQIHVTGAGDNNGSQTLYHTSMTHPMISASVSNIVSPFDEADTLCFQVILTSSFNGSYASEDQQLPSSQFAITNGQSGLGTSGIWYKVAAYLNGSTGVGSWPTKIYTRTGGGSDAGAGLASNETVIGDKRMPTFYELVASPGAIFVASAVSTGSSGDDVDFFPRPLSTSQFRSYGTMQAPTCQNVTNDPGPAAAGLPGSNRAATPPQWSLIPSNMNVTMVTGVTQYPLDTEDFTMGITTTWKKLRILRRTRRD